MASTFTAFLKFNKPSLGDAGWGTAVNGGFTDLVDQAITGFIQKAVTVAGPNALGSIADGASSDARNQFILLTGTLASPATLTVPVGTLTGSAGNNKLYFIKNTAGNAVTITNGGASTVVVPDGKSMMLRSTSTGVEEAMTHQFSLSLGTALAAPSGGTGQSSYAVGDLLYADTTTTLTKLAAAAVGNVLRAKGTGTAPAWEQVVLTTDVTGVLPVANGGTGLSAPGASGNVLRSNGTTWTSSALSSATDTAEGLVELATTAEIQTGTDTTRAITPAGLRGGMIVSPGPGGYVASGAAQIDITPIPSWVRRITVTFEDVSTNGNNKIDIQVGDAGGIETSGYVGSNSNTSTGVAASLYAGHAFEIRYSGGAAQYSGAFTLIKAYTAGDLWIGTGMHATGAIANVIFSAGRKTLSQTLDRLRISAGGNLITGIVNILYE
jgi:hypothetical protein